MDVFEEPPKSPKELDERDIKVTDSLEQDVDSASQTYSKEESDREEERSEHKVHFKEQLVDLEIPPDERGSSSSSSSSSSDEEETNTKDVTTELGDLNLSTPKSEDDVVEISGQFLKKDEKILVEIGGRFHVVEAGEIENGRKWFF